MKQKVKIATSKTRILYHSLIDRALIVIEGVDTKEFLQGLISNDINKATSTQAIYAALLTAQGKYLHDFFITEYKGVIYIDCEESRSEDLIKRLSMYKLRASAEISNQSNKFSLISIFGEGIEDLFNLKNSCGVACEFFGGVAFYDPRHVNMGIRAILPRNNVKEILEKFSLELGTRDAYNLNRLKLGLPDSSNDLIVGKSILLENGFDELNGIDWNKGCYVGQELTARTKHRGLIKKRLVPVIIDGPQPNPGTIILWEGKDAGEMRSSINEIGLALLRLEFLKKHFESGIPFISEDTKLNPQKPKWANF